MMIFQAQIREIIPRLDRMMLLPQHYLFLPTALPLAPSYPLLVGGNLRKSQKFHSIMLQWIPLARSPRPHPLRPLPVNKLQLSDSEHAFASSACSNALI
jgi:hypothetical protein